MGANYETCSKPEAGANRAADMFLQITDGKNGNMGSLINLLADLRHWCDSYGEDFDEAQAHSYARYVADKQG